jgi:cytochrome P450
VTSAVYPSTTIWPLRRLEEDPLAFLQMLASSHADVVPFRLGRRPAFLLNHPTVIDDVLVKQAETFVKGRAFDRAKRLLGEGLLTSSGISHAARRRVVTPAFHHRRIAAYGAVIAAHAVRLQDRWERGRAFDLGAVMQELTLAIAGEILFGADLGARASEVREAVRTALPSMDGLISLVALPAHVRRARRRLMTIVDAMIAQRIESGEMRDDLLALLLETRVAGDDLSLQRVRDDALTILLAGHDTVSHALTWTWMLLARHSDVDRRLHGELERVLGDRLPSAQDVSELPYTRAVFAEALRLFPPAWVIVRQATRSHRYGTRLIPAGALVVVSPFVSHRDPRFFPDPLTFEPERWLTAGSGEPAAASARRRIAFLPFGAGPRSCIGESLAWTEGVLVLATLARRWRLTRPGDAPMEPSPRITLRPKGEVNVIPDLRSV